MYNQERLLETYYELIKTKSISGNEKKIAQYIADKLINLGLEVNWSYYDGKQSPSLYAKLKGKKEGPTLLLIGHIDTVDVARGWETDPFVPHKYGDKVYGLGSMDMKGGLSAILETLESIVENEIELAGDLVVAFVADEEVKSRGTYTLLEDGLKADMAIMAECRFLDAAIGFRGRCNIVVDVYGEAGHASKYPDVGENAIIKAGELAREIEALSTEVHPKLGAGTWCVRHISGGTKKTLSVPDVCELFVDRYTVPPETFAGCMDQVKKLADDLNIKVDVRLESRPTPFMEPFSISEENEMVLSIAKNYKNVTGEELTLKYDKSVCDSNFLVTIGNIPTVTFGPSGENMHGANECGYVSQIKQATEIYIKTINDLLS